MNFSSIPKHKLSKSTFMYGVQCTKRVWLNKNLPKEKDVQTAYQTRIFQQGTDVGLLAQQLFPGGINAEPENYYSFPKSVADTLRYIRSGHQIIYEAAFQYEGILCALDLLIKIDSKWYAYEVKSTNSVKNAHINDAALQYFVITNAGIELADFSIIHLNKNYIRKGDLDVHQLFQPVSILGEVRELNPFISSKSVELLEVLSKNTPPDIRVGDQCNIPYPCDFKQFCNNGIFPSENSVIGIMNDKDRLVSFANNLEYPVFFLFLQTWSTAIPLFDGHSPYKQICFQFSVHKQDAPGAPLEHSYFLEEGINTQQKELIESLIDTLEEKGSIVVHHNSFLKYHLQELKKPFEYLDKTISSIQKRVIELPASFHVDFRIEEILKEPSYALDVLETENIKADIIILDSSSAAATYYNLRLEKDVNKIKAARRALMIYGEISSIGMANLIENIITPPII